MAAIFIATHRRMRRRRPASFYLISLEIPRSNTVEVTPKEKREISFSKWKKTRGWEIERERKKKRCCGLVFIDALEKNVLKSGLSTDAWSARFAPDLLSTVSFKLIFLITKSRRKRNQNFLSNKGNRKVDIRRKGGKKKLYHKVISASFYK